MFRFKLKSLLIFVTVLCVLGAFISALPRIGRSIYYYERNRVERVLEGVDSIENVSISAFSEEIYEEVVSTSFSVKGRPDTFLTVNNLESPSDGLRLGRIGNYYLWRTGVVELSGGSTTTSFQLGVDFSQLKVLISEDVECIDDLVQHYDRIVELAASLPAEAGQATYEIDGITRSYFVQQVEDPAQSGTNNDNNQLNEPAETDGMDGAGRIDAQTLTEEEVTTDDLPEHN